MYGLQILNFRISKLFFYLLSENEAMKIIFSVYVIFQALVLCSLLAMKISLTIHTITMALACIFYFLAAFKKPGYFQGEANKQIPNEDKVRPQNKQSNDEQIVKQIEEEQNEKNKQNFVDNLLGQKIYEIQCHKTFEKPLCSEKINQEPIKIVFSQNSFQKGQKFINKQTHQAEFILEMNNTQVLSRYCQICKLLQPLRVRHCYQCSKCICTFDHHCPWMGNCIGQKNRNIFWIFLLLQFIEFLLVSIDTCRLAIKTGLNLQKIVFFFGVLVLLMTIISLTLLVFHTYLMMNNLTTWQFARWDRINYLSIYKYKKSSPFSYGLIRNIGDYFNFNKDLKHWTINPEFQQKNKEFQIQNNYRKNNLIEEKNTFNVIKIEEKVQTFRIFTKNLVQ